MIPCQLPVSTAEFLNYFPVALNQVLHYYYFDWATKKDWRGTAIVKRKNLTTPQEIRQLRKNMPIIQNGGRHFSYMGGVDRIINKMKAIVEGNEFLSKNEQLTNRDHIMECMRTGKDIYGRQNIPESQFYPYDIEKINLPYLDEFLKKYPYFLREYDFKDD